ncbi:Uncharacterised protein [Mycobacteroides abscessus]|nr:Uncharacterised protein [Mycobacteroides abscessus]
MERRASTSSGTRTGNGMAWIVSPSAVAASATRVRSCTSSAVRPISVSVFGRPTRVVKRTNSSISSVGAPSRTSCVTEPMFTFWPCVRPCVWGAAVRPLWIACAAARPPDSKPSPDSSVFASTTFSTAGVTRWFFTASIAGSAFSQRMSHESCASAVPVTRGRPPAMVDAFASATARASIHVASASPTPATRNFTGAFATRPVSTSTRSGLCGKNRYSSNAPSSV